MIINPKSETCFIHLHKCCGKTITKILKNQFAFFEARPMPWQAHDGVNEARPFGLIDGYKCVISLRDPVEIFCSKISMAIKNNKNYSLEDLDVFFDSYVYKNKFSVSNPKESQLIKQKRVLLFDKFKTGLITHQMLFQTCNVENIHNYSDIEEFFKKENKIDFIIRKETLKQDLEKLLGKQVKMEHKNVSFLTEEIKKRLTQDQIETIMKKEKLFYKLFKGELNDYIRRHR